MPQIFKIGSYIVYFWSDESRPIEPIHVHIAEGKPTANATKIWITRSGKTLIANNNSQIPGTELRKLLRIIESNTDIICTEWVRYFGTMTYYC